MRLLILTLLFIAHPLAWGQAPQPGESLPTIEIAERGEMHLAGEDDVSFSAWSSDTPSSTVHILQYFDGTSSASKIFEPFTDALQARFELGTYHVTTVVNLDEALWGTGGFVLSEVEKNKREFPSSTMVVDDDGIGKRTWELGKGGAGLVIMDPAGVVRYFTRQALSESELAAAVELVGGHIAP